MNAEISLNSFVFLLIAVIAVLGCRLFAARWIREVIVFLLSLYFISTFVAGWREAAVLASFLAIVFAVGLLKARSPQTWPAFATFAIVAAFWIWLFMLKDPSLLGKINPFQDNPVKIIGISYIVFRGITFVLEVTPGDKLNPIRFINYILFFPTLLAGPIERYKNFDAAVRSPLAWDEVSYRGLNRILNGVIKKFVIADNLMDFGIFSMMGQGGDFSTPMLWIGALSMLALLYLDFSGYCDIVIGVAALMGINIVENFNRPFSGKNLQEFWSRWHMSLSSVIQDYVFSPLSKAVILNVPKHRQLYGVAAIYVVSMVLVAMWHGTTLGFLIFGVLNGAVLFTIQILRERARAAAKAKGIKLSAQVDSPVRIWLGRAATYAFVSLTMIFWYSSVPAAIATYRSLLGLS